MLIVLSALIGYFLGSFNFSIVLSRDVFGKDVRDTGSGNAGATNMARAFGLGHGFLALFGDMFKAGLAMFIGLKLGGELGYCVAGFASLLGHCFPVFHGFKGGKGISVGAAIGLAIDWKVLVIIVIVFLIAAFLSKKVSLGSVCAALAMAIACIALGFTGPRLILGILTPIVAIFQHRENIKRLIKGTEPDFKAKKP